MFETLCDREYYYDTCRVPEYKSTVPRNKPKQVSIARTYRGKYMALSVEGHAALIIFISIALILGALKSGYPAVLLKFRSPPWPHSP